jgi:hypothetical protein
MFSYCLLAWRWPGLLVRIIIIVIAAAAAGRWEPSAVLPLAAGTGLGGWLLAAAPGRVAVAR